MDRRTFLQSAGLAATPLSSHGGTLDGAVDAATGATTDAGTAVFDPAIRELKYPLSFVPAIRQPGERLRVELAAPAEAPAAWLRPTVGDARPRIDLDRIRTDVAESRIWRGQEVTVAEYAVPDLAGDVVETLYDLGVAWSDGRDVQHGAVDLVEQFPDEPTIAVLADPQTGDTGVIQQAVERSAADGDPSEARFITRETLGTDPGDDRWQALRRAVAELRVHDPDLVVTVGDLVNNADASPKSHVEWTDAHRILTGLDAPTVTTLGNHDGYNQTGADGYRLYERYFAPLYYSVDLRPGLHLVSANTYDWSPLDRASAYIAVSAWGGQIRDAQFEWLATDLRSWRAAHPDGDILVVGHHDPAALQDDAGQLADQTDGTPVAEQFGRGLDSQVLQGGQIWYGKNRLAFRDLLADVDAGVYFTGHTHRDRLARYHGDGNIVRTETPGPSDFETGRLQYVTRDGTTDDSRSQDELREILREPAHGPLFVETTTACSGTGQYWGWRLLETGLDGVDPAAAGGYPASSAFLDERIKADRGGWTAAHADLGLYSHPTYRLDVTVERASDRRVELSIENGLATSVPGASVVSLAATPGVRVDGASVAWRRTHDGRQDVKVTYGVPAETAETVVVEGVGPEQSPDPAPTTPGPPAGEP